MTAIRFVGKQNNRVGSHLRLKFDYWLALAVAGLLVVGMLMVYSTTFDYGVLFHEGDATFFFERQLQALAIGLVAIFVIMQFDYHLLRRFSVPLLVGTLLLLVVTLFFGEAIFGARRGLSGGSYQPSEVAKLVTILYIAHWLSTKGDRIRDLTYGLVPFSVITGVVCALIVRQPDLSTAALIALISYSLFFVAGADWRQLSVAGIIGLVAFVFLMLTLPHARGRVDAYAAALRDPSQASWHVQQSLIALANGRWFGVGLGESTQKFGPLPAAHTDSVFAVLGEEMGLLGCLLTIALFGILVWRGFRTARKARDNYGSLLALGITCWLSFQALINIAVITAVVPFTGLPLPFLSYGGSSLAISLVGVGILLNISRDAAINTRIQGQRPPRARTMPAGGPG
ncbi:MAG: putative lipid II flippase FtsW [Anaerolineales bacterium]|nr:putative lipid II flippase FtsW [Anaerolineales bacterium]MCB8952332.1 putative lipid II flippase FtsW [Ardenticatenales bacterium]